MSSPSSPPTPTVIALLLVILAADLGWKAWSARPYIVTGISSGLVSNSQRLSVRYTLPGGATNGLWEADGREPGDFWCWDKAEVGKRIPDCMTANWKARILLK